MCGTCLIASTEVIRKLPDHERLPDGYGCVAIPDVQDIAALSRRLAVVVRDSEPIAAVAAQDKALRARCKRRQRHATSSNTCSKRQDEGAVHPRKGVRRPAGQVPPRIQVSLSPLSHVCSKRHMQFESRTRCRRPRIAP
jgi:hypothetical protein